jgi:hypothetical protein
VEELGAFSNSVKTTTAPSSSHSSNSNASNNGQPRLRDRLCLLIRHYNLDPNLVKAYATDFCGIETRRRKRDEKFVDLGRYLCEVRCGQYWRIDKMKSFDEFLEKRFPDSRRKAYYLMAIHENLTRVPTQQLREIGWSKATELAKIARREGAV